MVRNQLQQVLAIRTPATIEELVKSVRPTGATLSLVMSASVHQALVEFTASTILMNVRGTHAKTGVFAQIWLPTIPVTAQESTWGGTVNTNAPDHWVWRAV